MDTNVKNMDEQIVKRILDALNNNEINYTEAQQISHFFLLNSNNKTDMYAFLETLTSKWHIFDSLFTRNKIETQYSKEDAQKLDKIKEQLMQFTKTT